MRANKPVLFGLGCGRGPQLGYQNEHYFAQKEYVYLSVGTERRERKAREGKAGGEKN